VVGKRSVPPPLQNLHHRLLEKSIERSWDTKFSHPSTNPIESCLSTVQRVARNVKRWREGSQPLRWTATGLLEAEKKFRRIKGSQEILLLKERLNPSCIPQKEVRTLEVA
jgi:hypothetical protein